jgi:hypothetical protein
MDEDKKDESLGLKNDDSSISMLRKDLYARDEPEELKKRSKELFTPKQPVVLPEAVVTSQPELVDEMTTKNGLELLLLPCLFLHLLLRLQCGIEALNK